MVLKRMKLPKLLMVWHERFLHVSIWVSEEGQEFENFSKKRCFLNFECQKPNFTTFGPRGKTFGKIH